MAKGDKTSYIGLKSSPEEFWESLVPEFEKKTGISVKYEAFEQAQARQKIATELTAGMGSLNTFRTTRGQDFAQYGKNGWYEPLDSFINDPALVAPDFDLKDFFDGSLSACTLGGQVIALPVTNGGQFMFIRKDLLDKKGLDIPKTFEELEETAKALHDPPNVYGFTCRGQKSAAVSMFAAFLHNFGADYMGENGKTPSLDTPEAIAAYQYYGGLLKNYGPPGITNMSHVELLPMFQQGKSAIYCDDLSFRGKFEDPKSSRVVGKVAYAKFPAGPKRNTPTIYVYGMAISSQSQHKLASWLWIQFLASKEIQVKALKEGISAGRKSSWENPEAIGTAPRDWVDTAMWTFANGDDEWAPPVISVPEARDIAGSPITVAIEGGDVAAAAKQANKDLTALAKRDGVI
jgi:multiple sugar transport system substrate-binding protein